MKAPPFAYVRPATVADAVAELARAGDDGKVLAGGQSNQRSAVPLLEGRPPVDGQAAVYVCERFACQAPVTDPAQLV